MKSRRTYLLLAALVGGSYGMLLGFMTAFPFPSGLGMGLLFGYLVGHAQTRHLLQPPRKLGKKVLQTIQDLQQDAAHNHRTHF